MAAKFTGPIPTIFSVNSPTTPESNIGYSNFSDPTSFSNCREKNLKIIFRFLGYPISPKTHRLIPTIFCMFKPSGVLREKSSAKKIVGSLRKLSVFSTNLF